MYLHVSYQRWTIEKDDLHTLQELNSSPVYICICIFNLELCEKTDPHISQEYGFSPVWVRICCFNDELWENAEPHTSHAYGFSPVCVCMWFFKIRILRICRIANFTRIWFLTRVCLYVSFQSWTLRKSRTTHFTLFICMCIFKSEPFKNSEPQTSRDYDFSLVCICIWFFKNFLKIQTHTPHKNMISLQCVFVYVFLKMTYGTMLYHTFHKNEVSFHYVFVWVFLN